MSPGFAHSELEAEWEKSAQKSDQHSCSSRNGTGPPRCLEGQVAASSKSPLLSLKDQVSPYCKCMQSTSSPVLCTLHGACTEPREVKGGSFPPVLPCPLPLSLPTPVRKIYTGRDKSSSRKISAIKKVPEPTKNAD